MVGTAVRAANANPGRTMGSFIDECLGAAPKEVRGRYQLWLRVDPAGPKEEVAEAAGRHDCVFTVTAEKTTRAKAPIVRLAGDAATIWLPERSCVRGHLPSTLQLSLPSVGDVVRLGVGVWAVIEDPGPQR